MKKIVSSILLIVFAAFTAQAQQVENIAASKSLAGIWRQVVSMGDKKLYSGNYKVINSDGSFFSFVTWGGSNGPTTIGMYGTYKITSDSTYTEYINKHGLNSKMDKTNSVLRFKLKDENTLLLQYKNEQFNKWIPELWERVPMSKSRTRQENTQEI